VALALVCQYIYIYIILISIYEFLILKLKNMIIKSTTIFHKFLAILFDKWFTFVQGLYKSFYDFDHIFENFVIKD
jgi:hypothetical protein